jgi:hypothetical protein
MSKLLAAQVKCGPFVNFLCLGMAAASREFFVSPATIKKEQTLHVEKNV